MRSGVRVKESADTFPSLTAVDYKALMASKKIWCSLTALPTVQQEFVRISTASSASENRLDLEVRFIQNRA